MNLAYQSYPCEEKKKRIKVDIKKLFSKSYRAASLLRNIHGINSIKNKKFAISLQLFVWRKFSYSYKNMTSMSIGSEAHWNHKHDIENQIVDGQTDKESFRADVQWP